ncbi:MAG: hypothetical protein KC646_15445 [Candidatus Cloacimonetes bacterium]|nr:hypothetical protein [Candidatus Cloacimonadota bacterium]
MNSIDYGYYFLEIFLRFDALFNYLKVLSDNSIEVLSYGIEPIKLAIFTLVPRTFWDSKPFSISLILQKHFTADLDNLKQGYFFSSAYYLSEAYLVFGLIGPFLYGTIQGFFIKVLDNSYLFNLKLKQFGPFCMYYIFVFLSLDIALEGFSGMKFQLIIGYLGFIYILFLANFFNFKQTSKY